MPFEVNWADCVSDDDDEDDVNEVVEEEEKEENEEEKVVGEEEKVVREGEKADGEEKVEEERGGGNGVAQSHPGIAAESAAEEEQGIFDVNWADCVSEESDAEGDVEEHDAATASSAANETPEPALEQKVDVATPNPASEQENDVAPTAISSEDLENILMKSSRSIPPPNFGGLKETEDVASIPIVPAPESAGPAIPRAPRFEPVYHLAPRTKNGLLRKQLVARPAHKVGYRLKFRAGKSGKNKSGANTPSSGPRKRFKLDVTESPSTVRGDKDELPPAASSSSGGPGGEGNPSNFSYKIRKSERLRREERNFRTLMQKAGVSVSKRHDSSEDKTAEGPADEQQSDTRAAVKKGDALAMATPTAEGGNATAGSSKGPARLSSYAQFFFVLFVASLANEFLRSSGTLSPQNPKEKAGKIPSKVDFSTMHMVLVNPGPNENIGFSQQPFPYTFDISNYNELLYYNGTDEVPPPGRLTLWIDGEPAEHEDLVLPKLLDESISVFRWTAYVPKENAALRILGLGTHTIGISYSGEHLEAVVCKNETVVNVDKRPQNARVGILTPDQGQMFALQGNGAVEVRWQLVNFKVPRDGHLSISLDGNEGIKVAKDEHSHGAQLADMSEGKHSFQIALISREDGQVLDEDAVHFDVVQQTKGRQSGELELLKEMPLDELLERLDDDSLSFSRREMIEKIIESR